MKIIADMHTHTVASTHAYSTILENAQYAKSIGLSYLAMTDHAPQMTDSPHIWHFHNLRSLPEILHDVRIFKGVEANIKSDGSIDMQAGDFESIEWAIASLHPPVFGVPLSIEEQTNAYVRAASNPFIDCIGHSGLARYPYNYEKAVKEFGRLGKLVEINEHTFACRRDGIENCQTIAKMCKKHSVRVVVNSDAHFAYAIGSVEKSLQLLKEINFPEELVLNASEARLNDYLTLRQNRISKL